MDTFRATVAEVTGEARVLVVHLEGELDLLSAPQLTQTLRDVADLEVTQVVFAASRLSFIDLAGMRVLAHERAARMAQGAGVTVAGAPRGVQRALVVAGLPELLDAGGTGREHALPISRRPELEPDLLQMSSLATGAAR